MVGFFYGWDVVDRMLLPKMRDAAKADVQAAYGDISQQASKVPPRRLRSEQQVAR